MPGFTGVSGGEWVEPTVDIGDAEIYFLLYGAARIFVGRAGGSVIERTGLPVVPGSHFYDDITGVASFGSPATVQMIRQVNYDSATDGNEHRFSSSDGGVTWVDTTTAVLLNIIRIDHIFGPDDYFQNFWGFWRAHGSPRVRITGSYDIQSGVTGVTPTHAYLGDRIIPHGPVQYVPIAGAFPVELISSGDVVGQVGDGMLIVDGSGAMQRYVGTTPTACTGLPAAADGALRYVGVACDGDVVMLTAIEATTEKGRIYKSGDAGLTWALAKEWDAVFPENLDPTVGYAHATPGVWWASGAKQGGAFGFWRTANNGLTWSFIAAPAGVGSEFIPRVSSSARNVNTSA